MRAVAKRKGRSQVGLADGGSLRWVAVDLTAPLQRTRARLDLSPVATVALGRSLSGAALLQRLFPQRPSRLTLEIRGDGPLRMILVEAREGGTVRGMVGSPKADVGTRRGGELRVGRAVGKGLLRVVRDFPNGRSHSSQVELVSGEIGKDLAHFLEQSEQIRSAVLLGVLAQPDGVAAAGGFVVEVLPGTSDATVRGLERRITRLGGVSRVLAEGGIEGLREELLAGLAPEVCEEETLTYRCDCSRERVLAHLSGLGPEDLTALGADDGGLEVECVFCAERYAFADCEVESRAEAEIVN